MISLLSLVLAALVAKAEPPPEAPSEVVPASKSGPSSWAEQVPVRVSTIGLDEAQSAVFVAAADEWGATLDSLLAMYEARVLPVGQKVVFGFGPETQVILAAVRAEEAIILELIVVGFAPSSFRPARFDPRGGCSLEVMPIKLLGHTLHLWRKAVYERLEPGHPLITALGNGFLRVRLTAPDIPGELVAGIVFESTGASIIPPLAYVNGDQVAAIEPALPQSLTYGWLVLEPPGRLDLDGQLRPYNHAYDFLGVALGGDDAVRCRPTAAR